MPPKYAKAGLSWRDVEEWIEDLEKEHQCVCVLVMRTQARALGSPMGLLVRLEATIYRDSGRLGATRSVEASWPTYHHRTMPGLVLYLVHAMRETLAYNPPRLRKQVKVLSYPRD